MPSAPTSQANVEYWFRLLYDLFYGDHGSVNYAALHSFFAHVWLWVIYIGYILAIAAFFFIIYGTVRLFKLREHEEHEYGKLLLAPEGRSGANPRWRHIESLIGGTTPSEWKEAIIEADIMLDDMLTRQGYAGDGVGEKLQAVEPSDFDTLQNAWEAHKVRNQIAHQGSSFDLSSTLARRTIAQYETVFREFEWL